MFFLLLFTTTCYSNTEEGVISLDKEVGYIDSPEKMEVYNIYGSKKCMELSSKCASVALDNIQYTNVFGPYSEYDIISPDFKTIKDTYKCKEGEHIEVIFNINSADIMVKLLRVGKNYNELVQVVRFNINNSKIAYGKAEDNTINTFRIYNSEKQFGITKKNSTIGIVLKDKVYNLTYNEDFLMLELMLDGYTQSPVDFEKRFEETLKKVQQLYSSK